MECKREEGLIQEEFTVLCKKPAVQIIYEQQEQIDQLQQDLVRVSASEAIEQRHRKAAEQSLERAVDELETALQDISNKDKRTQELEDKLAGERKAKLSFHDDMILYKKASEKLCDLRDELMDKAEIAEAKLSQLTEEHIKDQEIIINLCEQLNYIAGIVRRGKGIELDKPIDLAILEYVKGLEAKLSQALGVLEAAEIIKQRALSNNHDATCGRDALSVEVAELLDALQGTTGVGGVDDLETQRITDENNMLWTIFKTCVGCRRIVPGVIYGCDIQHHISWKQGLENGFHCNQREDADGKHF